VRAQVVALQKLKFGFLSKSVMQIMHVMQQRIGWCNDSFAKIQQRQVQTANARCLALSNVEGGSRWIYTPV
jgi:hypothetical protein